MKKMKKSQISKIESIRIGLASPEKIRQWAERTLPNGKIVGQVVSSQTVNYKTFKPEKGGLFCERIFGPITDYECSCGKKKNKIDQKFCLDCDVEFTSSRVRRHRLGYIQLASPVTHVWYLRGTPSYIGVLLDTPRKKLEAITYCTETISLFSSSKIEETAKTQILSTTKKKQETNLFRKDPLLFPENQIFLENQAFIESKKKYTAVFLRLPLVLDKFLFFNVIIQSITDLLKKKKNTKNHNILQFILKKNQELINEIKTKLNNLKDEASINNTLTDPFEEILFEQSKLKKKPFFKGIINNYYSIAKDCSWEMQNEWNCFLYYMSSLIKNEDTCIFLYSNWQTYRSAYYVGAQAIRQLLVNLDLSLLDKQLRFELFELNEEIHLLENQGFLLINEQRRLQFLLYRRSKKIRRLKILRYFRQTQTNPEWMVLSCLPVLPPDLRPIIQLDGDQVAVSDLNKLYQKVLFRNNRIQKHRASLDSTSFWNKSDEVKYAQRLLQESVDALLENGKGGIEPICAANDRPLKSLSDMLKGKKGRFRQNLLGKRVDYSGRSVIVVGPTLKLHECGLPKEMAIELFQPFLLRQLIAANLVRTIAGAKKLLKTQEQQNTLVWSILRKVMENHPILLNRAPTLHRLSIQAFQPKLINGRAILLHPLVCTAFNADFDGDQMAVHVPLSFEARAEAWKLMWSRNNLLSPATGQPILLPSQDMVLGCYYATTINSYLFQTKISIFSNIEDALCAYNQNKIKLHEWVWVRWNSLIDFTGEIENPKEIRVLPYGHNFHLYLKSKCLFNENGVLVSQFIYTTIGRILVNSILNKSNT